MRAETAEEDRVPHATTPVGLAIGAVLFDMDGTLADTEAFWQVAEDRIVNEHGSEPLAPRDSAQVGASMDDGATFLKERYGISLTVAEIQRLTVEYVLEQVGGGFGWRPGARELLSEVNAARIPAALVTTSPRSVAEAVISVLPEGVFDVVIADEDVSLTKPDPAPYLAAARALGIDPSLCVAIEDSPTGTESARRAGCFVVTVPTQMPVEPAANSVVLSSLDGITLHTLGEFFAARISPQE